EIGPASGFITAALEQGGATVTALEVQPSVTWDFVPFPGEQMAENRARHADHMEKIRQSFWYTHQAFRLQARLVYAAAGNIPPGLGAFDVALLGVVLLHAANPQRIVAECARVARTVVITELLYPDLEDIGGGIVRLHPTRENGEWHIWWHFSTGFFAQYLSVLGLTDQRVTFHRQRNARNDQLVDFFTIVASRPERALPYARFPKHP